MVFDDFDVIVAQGGLGDKGIAGCHNKSARHYAYGSFKRAHMDVQNLAVYTFAAQQGCRKCDHGGVVGAQNFLHALKLGKAAVRLKPRTRRNTRTHAVSAATPVDALIAVLADDLEAVNQLIETRMESENAPRIPEVTAHLVGAGGKRLRPILTLACARLCGYEGTHHQLLATTVEFIHTATLLHDDVVDESAQRRGRPTANMLWDNKSSVLVGDYLFSRSFQLMVETGSLRILDILSNASAVIAEGEVLQLSAAMDISTDEDIYTRVIRGKTAALFAAACEVGGVVAEAPDAVSEAMRRYGDALGMSFQIVDDLLDYDGASVSLGKNTGDDFRERKLTLPVIRAIAAGNTQERAFWTRVIEKGDQQDGDLETAIGYMKAHDTLNSTRATALAYASAAKEELSALPTGAIRDHLRDLADFVVLRVS